MYRLGYDPTRNLMTIHVSGFLSPEEVPPFATAILAQSRAAAELRGDFDVLVESLDFPVQANDVADMLGMILHDGIDLTTGCVAVVVGSQLNKLQVERTLAHPRVKPFRAVADALRWLADRKAENSRRAAG